MTDITYTWQVRQLHTVDIDDKENVVKKVDWRLVGEKTVGEKTYAFDSFNTVEFDTAVLDPFTAYPELTEAQVIEWVVSTMGEDAVKSYEEVIARQIELQIEREALKTPGMPWVPAPEEIPLTTEEVTP